MREAKVNDEIIQAAPDSPDHARCPACGAPVVKRKRRRMDGSVVYFYCHVRGEGERCLLRYSGLSD
jgi:formylmethanofuran dehydrogenase subunit E